MWQIAEQSAASSKVDAANGNRESQERKSRVDIVDLYEELLTRRAEMGYRPVIYVSSERDLECNLIGMFESEVSTDVTGEAVPSVDTLDELRRRLL